MNNKELRAAADACFAADTTKDLFYQTADGQCFSEWHDANEHSKAIGQRAFTEVRRDDAKQGTLTTEEKIEQINACASVDELTEIKIGNKENPAVKEAFNAKMKAFKDAEAKNKK